MLIMAEKSYKKLKMVKSGYNGLIPFMTGKGKEFSPTRKIIIIGPSGSGKTVLAFQIAYFWIKNYNRICYISPQADDNIVCSFISWCEAAGIGFEHFIYSTSKKEQMELPEYENCLYIVDDYYTSTGKPAQLTTFISVLINRGRHKGNHIIYNAQASDRIPMEWWSGFDVCLKFADEKTFEKTYTNKYEIEKFLENNGHWQFKSRLEPGWKLIVFKTIHHNQEIVRNLRRKKIKEEKKYASLETYKDIAKQGNMKAKETIKNSLMDCIVD